MAKFEMQGFENFGTLGQKFGKDLQRSIDNASKRGLTKGLENIVYGSENRISPNNIRSGSAVNTIAGRLNIKPHHVFFRTFTRNPKTSAGGKGARPFAKAWMRANGINVVSLLVDDVSAAKKMYGFRGRKRDIGSKTKPSNMEQLVESASVGGRFSGNVRIGNRTYSNTYIVDGRLRASSDYWDKFYIENLGAKRLSENGRYRKLGGKGNFIAVQRKQAGQRKPYPTKGVKIERNVVLRAMELGLKVAAIRRGGNVRNIQRNEVVKELKKKGFDVR